MTEQGPALHYLTQRIAETPELFLKPGGHKVRKNQPDWIEPVAVVSDLLLDLGGLPPAPKDVKQLKEAAGTGERYLSLVMLACNLLHHPWFMDRAALGARTETLLFGPVLKKLAALLGADNIIMDPERREEFVRLCLDGLGLVPEGETKLMARDRLGTLDSVERERIMEKTRQAQARARELREAQARREAEEAASKMTRD